MKKNSGKLVYNVFGSVKILFLVYLQKGNHGRCGIDFSGPQDIKLFWAYRSADLPKMDKTEKKKYVSYRKDENIHPHTEQKK